jgi:D-alanine-D-alanine ligase
MPGQPTDRARPSHGPLSVVVLLGGWSAERSISLASGRAVIRALRSRGHDVTEFDPQEMDLFRYPWAGVDVAFIALHGPFGEDGTVQTLLDELRVPYTGSGATASRLAMNKWAAKQRFLEHGLATPACQTVHAGDGPAQRAAKAAVLGYPLVVKPNAQGSSIGVSVVATPAGLDAAVEAALGYDPLVILEQFIVGRELTVAIIERRPLPVIEIRSGRAFFDFDAKYHDAATEYVFETDLPAGAVHAAEAAAVAAATAIGCQGVARVDLRLDADNVPWLLEINTVPGMTDHSLVPKAAARAGIDFAELCEQLARTKAIPALPRPGKQAA